MATYALVAAITENNGLGHEGKLPWPPKAIKADMVWFRDLTQSKFSFDGQGNITFSLTNNNVVVMGRKTWDSIPKNFKPLNNRLNCILSKDPKISDSENIKYITNISEVPKKENSINYVIGGATIYDYFINQKIQYMFITEVINEGLKNLKCDTNFPTVNWELYEKRDITKDVFEFIKESIDVSTYDKKDQCFYENDYKMKMYLYILK